MKISLKASNLKKQKQHQVMETLTSIAEHSDYLSASTYSDSEKWQLHRKRVKFGKQPLEIWQFVPCKLENGVWVVLTEPKYVSPKGVKWDDYVKQYSEAKELCLFEGFEFIDKEHLEEFSVIKSDYVSFNYDFKYKTIEIDRFYPETIEDLIYLNLPLTQTAKNQILK